jgi:hypothetical protein
VLLLVVGHVLLDLTFGGRVHLAENGDLLGQVVELLLATAGVAATSYIDNSFNNNSTSV